jgi:DNA-binding PadR family transcriptional regulator
VETAWGVSENNRRAKYYELTDRGRKQLEEETANWGRLVWAISRIVPAESP